MKSKLLSFFIFCALPLCLSATDETIPQKGSGTQNIPYDLHKEHDTTDIFAIQLDESEETENEEMYELEQIQKEEQAKKAH
jgi:hypothetical protein